MREREGASDIYEREITSIGIPTDDNQWEATVCNGQVAVKLSDLLTETFTEMNWSWYLLFPLGNESTVRT